MFEIIAFFLVDPAYSPDTHKYFTACLIISEYMFQLVSFVFAQLPERMGVFTANIIFML
jgi:hypothetical protein